MSRTGDLGSLYPKTYRFKGIVRSDRGSSYCQIMFNVSPGVQQQILYGDFDTTMYLGGYNGGTGVSMAFASKPAVDRPFFAYIIIEGTGANQYRGGWAYCDDASAFVTVSGALPTLCTTPTKWSLNDRDAYGDANTWADMEYSHFWVSEAVLTDDELAWERYSTLPCRAYSLEVGGTLRMMCPITNPSAAFHIDYADRWDFSVTGSPAFADNIEVEDVSQVYSQGMTSGSTYEVSRTESGTAAAALAVTLDAVGSVAEAGTGAAALAVTLDAAASRTEAGTSAAVLSTDMTANSSVSEAGTAAMAQAADMTFDLSRSEAGTAAAAQTVTLDAAGSVTEAGTGAAALSTDMTANSSVTEAVTAAMAQAAAMTFDLSRSEAGTAAAALSTDMTAYNSVTEAATSAATYSALADMLAAVTEAGTAAAVHDGLIAGSTYDVSLPTEAASASAAFAAALDALAGVTEAGASAAAVVATLAASAAVVEAIAAAAAQAATGTLEGSSTAAASAADTYTSTAAFGAALTEAGAAADAYVAGWTVGADVTEAANALMTLLDAIISLANTYRRTPGYSAATTPTRFTVRSAAPTRFTAHNASTTRFNVQPDNEGTP